MTLLEAAKLALSELQNSESPNDYVINAMDVLHDAITKVRPSTDPLVGLTITDLGYMDKASRDKRKWKSYPIILNLDDGSRIYPAPSIRGYNGCALEHEKDDLIIPHPAKI